MAQRQRLTRALVPAIAALALGACSKQRPRQELAFVRHLGESTKSPGANASKPQPVTPDDPRVMNVSAAITPQQAQTAAQAPLPQPQPAQARRDQATSSTPVTQPADIAPPSTTTDTNRPGVFSPPPPPAGAAPPRP